MNISSIEPQSKDFNLFFVSNSGGRDSRTRFDNTNGHIVRGDTVAVGSDLIIDKKPRAIPVLRRRVESLTVSFAEISYRRSLAHFEGKLWERGSENVAVLIFTHAVEICSNALCAANAAP